MSMNLDQVRVGDPVLTKHAQGYRQAKLVGHVLFPPVPVPFRAGQVIEFGDEGFRLYNSVRAPGADTGQITFGYEGKPFVLEQTALDARLPREHIQEVASVPQMPQIDLGMRAVNLVLNTLTLALEVEQAALGQDVTSYAADQKLDLDEDDQWGNPDSDPIGMIGDAMETVRRSTGMEPNVMVLGPGPYRALRTHPKVVSRFQGISAGSVTNDDLARLLDLEKVAVGKAVWADQDGVFQDVWGPHAILSYSPAAPGGNEEPSFGYTYTLNGHPFVEKPHWDNSKRSWMYGVTYERKPVLTGIKAGFLIQNAFQ